MFQGSANVTYQTSIVRLISKVLFRRPRQGVEILFPARFIGTSAILAITYGKGNGASSSRKVTLATAVGIGVFVFVFVLVVAVVVAVFFNFIKRTSKISCNLNRHCD